MNSPHLPAEKTGGGGKGTKTSPVADRWADDGRLEYFNTSSNPNLYLRYVGLIFVQLEEEVETHCPSLYTVGS